MTSGVESLPVLSGHNVELLRWCTQYCSCYTDPPQVLTILFHKIPDTVAVFARHARHTHDKSFEDRTPIFLIRSITSMLKPNRHDRTYSICHITQHLHTELVRSTKNRLYRFSNFMSPGPVKSVRDPVVLNGGETCRVSCIWWWQLVGNPILQ